MRVHEPFHSQAPANQGGPRARGEIDPRYTWNLNDIYDDWSGWEQDRAKLEEFVNQLGAFQGTVQQGADKLLGFLKLSDEAGRLFDRVWYYPGLAFDLDQRNNEINARRQQVEDLAARYSAATSWFDPELIELGQETVNRWLSENIDLALYKFHLDELFRQAEHVLDEKGEHLLALAAKFGASPSQTYSMLTTADATFPEVELSDGSTRRVTPGTYSSLLRTLPKQEDRQRVFQAHFNLYKQFGNTYAAIYNGVLQRGWFTARARGYDSVLERKLHRHAIPTSVVHTLVKAAKEGMKPLRRYHKLRKQTLDLDNYYLYDGFAQLLDHDTRYTFDEATQHIVSSVAHLGEDYQNHVRDAFEHRWVDVYETEGKRSGGYMASVYGVHPYILMNYHGNLDDVFTLAHEIGHAMHSELSDANQPFTYAGYTIFVAEVASTLNEALLLDQLLEEANSPEQRIMLLQHAIDTIAGTFYTQSLFANYELEAHKLAEAGQPITSDVLGDIYHGILTEWYGDAIDHEPLYHVTWARIPHFFHSPYYVYQYATSFASSAALFDAMKSASGDTEKGEVVERYLTLLKSGGSDHPMELLKRAGVDLNDPETVKAVVRRLDNLVTQLAAELKKV
ncbi:oligoendopeptidase F [bacterium]|nr:oligoendopeptidase F [bacterium]